MCEGPLPSRYSRHSPLTHLLSCNRARSVTAIQNCVVKIRRMRPSRIKCDDHALVLEIHLYVLHTLDLHKRSAQLLHSLMMILAFGGDFDRLQDGMLGTFREKRVGWIRVTWSCRVHRSSLSNAR